MLPPVIPAQAGIQFFDSFSKNPARARMTTYPAKRSRRPAPSNCPPDRRDAAGLKSTCLSAPATSLRRAIPESAFVSHLNWYTCATFTSAFMNRISLPLDIPRAIGLGLVVLAACVALPADAATDNAVSPSLKLTRFGETKPAGWMLRQMQADLDDGLAGHYPEISDSVNMREFETCPVQSFLRDPAVRYVL